MTPHPQPPTKDLRKVCNLWQRIKDEIEDTECCGETFEYLWEWGSETGAIREAHTHVFPAAAEPNPRSRTHFSISPIWTKSWKGPADPIVGISGSSSLVKYLQDPFLHFFKWL